MTDKIRSCNSSIPEKNWERIFGKEEKVKQEKEKWVCKKCKGNVNCELTIIEIDKNPGGA